MSVVYPASEPLETATKLLLHACNSDGSLGMCHGHYACI